MLCGVFWCKGFVLLSVKERCRAVRKSERVTGAAGGHFFSVRIFPKKKEGNLLV